MEHDGRDGATGRCGIPGKAVSNRSWHITGDLNYDTLTSNVRPFSSLASILSSSVLFSSLSIPNAGKKLTINWRHKFDKIYS